MKHIDPKDISVREIQKLMSGGVAPRPIALVSTISAGGAINLSPFSFFNIFGANPPVVAFSPTRRGRDGTTKDTYDNLNETRECVAQAVTHAMVEQVNLASSDYASDVDEFVKSGLTPIPSDLVKPPRVKESPFQMECRVTQIIPLGTDPGSGNLVICEVVRFHIDEKVIRNGVIDPDLIDLVGRNSADYYTRASGSAVFTVKKPASRIGVGFDQLPEHIKQSCILTANDLAQLAGFEQIPDEAEARDFISSFEPLEVSEPVFDEWSKDYDYRKMLQGALATARTDRARARHHLELTVKAALYRNDLDTAWKVVLYMNMI
ncbi:MAG: flavin reductase family protein [Candidatus Zixiibacteriota bacterium]|nr:MAG: flavin reductase family protein [candidate division Zixibacteria bacterium]